jgi:hypothetical protein
MKTPIIIITLDYEVFGSGSGDVRKFVIEPTDRLLKLLNTRKIKMTVFFEIEEFMAFRNHANKLKTQLGYDPALMIEEQIKKILHNGHEIGLHIHPQWIGATFEGNSFRLFSENQCLFDVYKNEEDLASYLNDRLVLLRDLVTKYDPSHKVICFRAGAHAIRPEKLTLKVMESLGLKADSSVVKGLYRVGKKVNLDYREAPYESGFWRVDDNVCQEESEGKILEFPIFSRMKPEYTKLVKNRIKIKFFSSRNPVGVIANSFSKLALPKNPLGIIKYLLKSSPLKFDYCHMTSKEMLSFLSDAQKEKENRRKYPLTMIGHSKEYFNDKHFAAFLDTVLTKSKATFRTMGEIVTDIEYRGL